MVTQQQETAWFIIRDGQQHGPVSDQEIQAMIARGLLKPTDMVWRDGFSDWQPCHQAFRLPQAAPPSIPQPPPYKGTAAQPRGEQQATQVCPHCQSTIPSNATVCRGCGAKKAYTNGTVYGFFNLIGQLIITVTGMVVFFFLAIYSIVPEVLGQAVGVILGAYLVWTVRSLLKGSRWIR